MATMTGSILCKGCGKQFSARPEYAGRKVKCKCGAVIRVPDAEPDNGQYDLALSKEERERQDKISKARAAGKCPDCNGAMEKSAEFCVHCGLVMKSGKKLATTLLDDEGNTVRAGAEKPKKRGFFSFGPKEQPSTRTSGRDSKRKPEPPPSKVVAYVKLGAAGVMLLVAGFVLFNNFAGGGYEEDEVVVDSAPQADAVPADAPESEVPQ
jgi:hypothetical protein